MAIQTRSRVADRLMTGILILGFVSLTSSQTDTPIGPISNDKKGWYSAPNLRGTADIIWTCLLTVFLSCWTAIHPTIPAPTATWTQQFLDRMIILFLGIMAPEVLIVIAGDEWIVSRELKTSQEVAWSAEHAFYAIMGGYATLEKTENNKETIVPLDYQAVVSMLEEGRIDSASLISRDEIRDKGKADSVVKALTMAQVVWLVVQSVARRIQNLPLTTLEFSTLAYVPCALLMYFFWWNKPYDVGVPTILRPAPPGTFRERSNRTVLPEIEEESYTWGDLSTRHHDQPFAMTKMFWDATVGACMPSDIVKRLMASVVFLMFGSIHMAAWNFDFPSLIERWGWRACSLLISASFPVAWSITAVLLRLFSGRWWTGLESDTVREKYWKVRRACVIIQSLAVVIYTLARMYLLVEAFVGLRAAPVNVFETPEWSNFIPHLG